MSLAAPTEQKHVDASSKKGKAVWVALNFIAVAIWGCVLTKLLVFDFDHYFLSNYAPGLLWVLDFKALILLTLFAFVICLCVRSVTFTLSLLYVIFFPLALLVIALFRLFFYNWSAAVAMAPSVYDFISSFKVRTRMFAVGMVCVLSIVLSKNPYIIGIGIVLLGVQLAFYLVSRLRGAYQATLFARLTQLVAQLRKKIEADELNESLFKRQEIKDAAGNVVTSAYGDLSLPYVSTWTCHLLVEKIDEAERKRAVDSYLFASFATMIIISVITFAFLYYGLHRIDPAAFSAAEGANYWSFLSYSFSTFMTANVSRIAPLSPLAQILSHLQLISFIIVLVVGAFVFLTALRENYREDSKQFVKELDETSRAIMGRLSSDLRQLPLESFRSHSGSAQ